MGISNPDDLSYISALIANVANELTALAEADWSLVQLGETVFNPLKTAVRHHMRQETDEACWLIFLSCHVGKHPKHGWNLVNAIYSGPDGGEVWTWEKVSGNSIKPLRTGCWIIISNLEKGAAWEGRINMSPLMITEEQVWPKTSGATSHGLVRMSTPTN